MNRMKYIRRLASVLAGLAGLAGGLLVFGAGAPAALASLPPPERAGGQVMPPAPVQVHAIVTGGMPGWQIALIAIGAALAAAAVAVLLDRVRAARRQVTMTGA